MYVHGFAPGGDDGHIAMSLSGDLRGGRLNLECGKALSPNSYVAVYFDANGDGRCSDGDWRVLDSNFDEVGAKDFGVVLTDTSWIPIDSRQDVPREGPLGTDEGRSAKRSSRAHLERRLRAYLSSLESRRPLGRLSEV